MSTTQELSRTLLNRASRIDLHGHLIHNGEADTLEALWCSDTADDMRAAAARLSELSAELDAVKAENAEAHDILIEYKAEIAKLAESDPEFDTLQKQRYPTVDYATSYSRGLLKASAENYRKSAMLALTDNIDLRKELDAVKAENAKLRALCGEAAELYCQGGVFPIHGEMSERLRRAARGGAG